MGLRTVLPIVLIAAITAGCSSTDPSSANSGVTTQTDTLTAIDTRIGVHVQPVSFTDFSEELLTNGTISADQSVEIKLRADGQIVQLPIVEGQFVQYGAPLYRQEDDELQLQLQQAHIAVAEAEVKLNEQLILAGGEAHDTTSVSAGLLQTFRTTSGWTAAKTRIKSIRWQIDQTSQYAPFSGLISDLNMQKHQQGNRGEVLCRLINPSTYEVTFTVLEQDIGTVSPRRMVNLEALALPGKVFRAEIYRINPVVNEQGLLTVRARIRGSGRGLYVGMKTNVTLKQVLPDRLVIPEKALVLRSNREVVFVADTSNLLAKWKYVTVESTNNGHHAVAEGLDEGDLIIVKGNLNLAHDAAIRIDTIISPKS